jgi:hypothetical protein
MLVIKKFDSYRDGGTISMRCNIGGVRWSKYLAEYHLNTNDEYEICLDGRLGKEPKIWLGYPESTQEGGFKHESQIIDDKELISYIIDRIESYKKTQNYRMDQFINFEVNLRDWKIKNITDEK